MALTKKTSDTMPEASVRAKTGKGWAHWFKALDAFGKRHGYTHKAAAKHLLDEHGLTPWWSQTVSIQYERERGLRDVLQRSTRDYEVNVQRTINAPIEKAWAACAEAKQLNKWFTTGQRHKFEEGGGYSNNDGDSGEYVKIVPHKLIRFTWNNPQHKPGSVVTVEFTKKGPDKTLMRLTHAKLKMRKDAEGLKSGWAWAADSLKSYLETGKGIRHEDRRKAQKKK